MLLAIDQGASKTTAAIAGMDGVILATASDKGACYFSAGLETAFKCIQMAAEKAASAAGIGLEYITHIFAGLAGANWSNEIEMLTLEFEKLYAGRHITVCNDCVIALRGGTDIENSIILCAGSGCNGAVMVDGKIKKVFNNYISDADQGGLALGGRALQAVFDSEVGIQPTTVLTDRLLAYYGYENVDQLLLGRDHHTLNAPIFTLVSQVLQAAEENDLVALDVIYEFSKSIARFAVSSLLKYDLVGKECEIVLSGGVFKSENPLFIETISAEVHRVSRQARIVNSKYEPIVGAVLLGLEVAGVSHEAIAVCRNSALTLDLVRIDRMKVSS